MFYTSEIFVFKPAFSSVYEITPWAPGTQSDGGIAGVNSASIVTFNKLLWFLILQSLLPCLQGEELGKQAVPLF